MGTQSKIGTFPRQVKSRWHHISLTFRLVLVIMGLLTLGLGMTGLTVIGVLQSHLIAQIDSELAASTRKIASYDNPLAIQINPNQPSTYYIRITYKDKIHELNKQAAEEYGIPREQDIKQLEEISQNQISAAVTIASENPSAPWRAISLPIVEKDTHTHVGAITVALPLLGINDTVRNSLIYVLVSSILFIFLGGLAAFFLVRLSLSPLRKIEAVAGDIANGHLDQRIQSEEDAHTEVGSLARSLNIMLSHIESAFATQKASEEKVRQFVSDASHELRTPLAAIKGYGELYRLGGVPKERTAEVMSRIESEATRMGELVDDLLKLARLDEGRKLRFSAVDLFEIGRAAQLDLLALEPKRQVKLLHLDEREWTPADEIELVYADRNQLTQIMTNLIGNINRYTSVDTPAEIIMGISTECGEQKQVIIQVRDHGNGVAEDKLDLIFERFYRQDTSRSRGTGGTGLGLSIVAAVAAVHGGSAKATTTPGGGLTIKIQFPFVEAAELKDSASVPSSGTMLNTPESLPEK